MPVIKRQSLFRQPMDAPLKSAGSYQMPTCLPATRAVEAVLSTRAAKLGSLVDRAKYEMPLNDVVQCTCMRPLKVITWFGVQVMKVWASGAAGAPAWMGVYSAG